MYLAKYTIDRNSPTARRALADRQSMHSLIQRMFGTDRKTSDVLYRVHGNSLYVSANNKPKNTDGLEFNFGRNLPSSEEGNTMHFSIVTIPRKCVNNHRQTLKTESLRCEWLNKQAEKNGFEIISVKETGKEPIKSRIKKNVNGDPGFDVIAFKYDGILRVTNPEKFDTARLKGIGSMKAYGCGMLLAV